MSRLYKLGKVTHYQDAHKETHALCGISLKGAIKYDPNKGKPVYSHSKPLRFINCGECMNGYVRGMAGQINEEY